MSQGMPVKDRRGEKEHCDDCVRGEVGLIVKLIIIMLVAFVLNSGGGWLISYAS